MTAKAKTQTGLSRLWAIALSLLTFLTGHLAAAVPLRAEPVFTVETTGIYVSPAQKNMVELVVRADNVRSTCQCEMEISAVSDAGIPTPPDLKISFKEPSRIAGSEHASTLRWLVVAEIEPGKTPFFNQQRYLKFIAGERQITLGYKISSFDPKNFDWTLVHPPKKFGMVGSSSIQLSLVVGPVPATGVSLVKANFLEDTTKNIIDWELCRRIRNGEEYSISCDKTIDVLAANSTHNLVLRPINDADLIGDYSGEMTINSSESFEGLSATLEFSSTSNIWRWIGFFIIMGSVGIAWITTYIVRIRLARNKLLLPVANLRERLAQLRARLKTVSEKLDTYPAHTNGAIDSLLTFLEASHLDRLGILPKPGNPLGDKPQYEKFMQDAADWFFLIDVIIDDGFEAILAGIEELGDPSLDTGILSGAAKITQALDAFFQKDNIDPQHLNPAPDRQAFTTAILDLTNGYIHSLAESDDGLSARFARGAPMQTRSKPRSVESIQLETASLNRLVWCVYLALTTLLGAYVLIVSDPGFGTAKDLIHCAFWGFGLPIGTQLSSQTPANIRQALNVQLPAQS